jgi:two-component system response regulator PilR (NtrC family)
MQVKLLRAIQEKAIRPVGANDEISIDVRILSATHKNLELEVQEGRFRNDLYYRINVIGLQVPNLRDRIKDIPLLAAFFLQRWSNPGSNTPLQLADSAYEALSHYAFPGNVRELENILERACTLCSGDRIEAQDLMLPSTVQRANLAGDSDIGADPEAGFGDLEAYLENIEGDVIASALEQTNGNITSAAKLLGISFRSLRYRLKKLKLDH